MEKSITYFEKEGENYTDELISLVKQRLDESDEIRYILIASASDAIEGDAQIINVSHHAGFSGPNEVDISDEMIDKLEEKGVDTFIGSHALSGVGRGITNKLGGINPPDIIADTLRMFSHGVKVACEISIMAADAGLIPVDEEIIAIGGRAHGVDTAVVLTPANMTNVFDLNIHEIIAMPRQ